MAVKLVLMLCVIANCFMSQVLKLAQVGQTPNITTAQSCNEAKN